MRDYPSTNYNKLFLHGIGSMPSNIKVDQIMLISSCILKQIYTQKNGQKVFKGRMSQCKFKMLDALDHGYGYHATKNNEWVEKDELIKIE